MKLYNTQSQSIEAFNPINPGVVSLYTCGPTVYSSPHIGNMRAYVHADLLKSVLTDEGYKVNHVINITDVGHLTSDADDGDDKMEKQAQKEGIKSFMIAEKYEQEFIDNLESLAIQKPQYMPRATEYIQEQIDFIKTLEEKGYTYKTSDGVYFDTSKISNYAEIAKIDKDGIIEGFRVDMGEKRNGTDFALWKFSPLDKQRDMEWDSPWGKGFPGWHIECSAMAKSLLGKHIDIHTGGVDHIHVHHAAEIAQSTAAHEHTMANYWSHVNFLSTDEKMSKSKGNIITVKNLEEAGFSPMVLKYFYYLSHYRSELSFDMAFENLKKAKNAYENLHNRAIDLDKESGAGEIDDNIIETFRDILKDDLNTPKALAYLFTTLKQDNINTATKLQLMKVADKILKLNLFVIEHVEIPENIQRMAEERWNAKQNKHWDLADNLRKRIDNEGFIIKDTRDGFIVEKK